MRYGCTVVLVVAVISEGCKPEHEVSTVPKRESTVRHVNDSSKESKTTTANVGQERINSVVPNNSVETSLEADQSELDSRSQHVDFEEMVYQKVEHSTRDGNLTVAVLDFVDKGPSIQLSPLRLALTELLSSDFSRYEGLRAVERVRISQFLSERELGEAGIVDAGRTQRMGEAFAADYLLLGTFSGRDNSVSVEATLVKPGATEPVAKWNATAPTTEFLRLEEQLASAILRWLEVSDDSRRPAPPLTTEVSPVVAIMAFQDLGATERLAPMEAGFAELLQANLSAFENIQLVEREHLHKVLREQQLSLSALSDPATAVKVGQLLKCERVIHGSFIEIGEQLRVIVRVLEIPTTEILASAMVSGATDNFADLMKALSLEVVQALAVQPPTNADDLVQAALPARQLESAIHHARGTDLIRQGKVSVAAAAFEQAVLVEPENVLLNFELVNAYFFSRDFKKSRDAALAALDLDFSDNRKKLKKKVILHLLESFRGLKQYREYGEWAERAMKEFQGDEIESAFRTHYGLALFAQHKIREAVELLNPKKGVEDDRTLSDNDIESLRTLSTMLDVHAQWKDVVPDEELRRECAVLGPRIAERIISACQGRRGIVAQRAAEEFLKQDFEFSWMDDNNEFHATTDRDQQRQFRKKAFEVFEWTLESNPDAYYDLAKQCFEGNDFEASLEAFERYLAVDEAPGISVVPSMLDWMYTQPGEVIDKKVEARYRVTLARVAMYNTASEDDKGRKLQDVRDSLQKFVREVGLVNFHGAQIADMLHTLGEQPVYPSPAVLLWGGGTEAVRAYERAFADSDYTFHSVRTQDVTPALLYPYRLVILARNGHKPYTPSDIMALRSYVATGGALLIVVSPGWEPSAPSLHNSLLSFWETSADSTQIIRAESTEIKPHAITEGLSSVMAKCAVELTAPKACSLIESDGKTLLAAVPYRHGRVVVASFGQWFFPEATALGTPWWLSLNGSHPTVASVDRDSLPVEVGDANQIQLLRNAVNWLIDDSQRDETYRQQRANIDKALWTAYLVYSQSLEWKHLAPAMDKMVAEADPGSWKEEALWIAGETSQQMVYNANNGFCKHGYYGYDRNYVLPAEPSYYRQLTERFVDSPLIDFAKWRLGECERRSQINAHYAVSHPLADPREANPEMAIEVFKNVEAPPGTVAWAWTKLRVGLLLIRDGQLQEAVACYREVADKMPSGPEKGIALLTLNVCLRKLGRPTEAEQYREAALANPDIFWFSNHCYASWTPLTVEGNMRFGRTTRKLANEDAGK